MGKHPCCLSRTSGTNHPAAQVPHTPTLQFSNCRHPVRTLSSITLCHSLPPITHLCLITGLRSFLDVLLDILYLCSPWIRIQIMLKMCLLLLLLCLHRLRHRRLLLLLMFLLADPATAALVGRVACNLTNILFVLYVGMLNVH